MPSSYLFVNGLRVHYLYWNLGDGGQPVVLLHGLASNARIWELVAPYLQGQGLQVMAPDLRGHGLTDKPDGDYGFETFHRDLAAFINTLELEKPLLVGHSWGAYLALDYAARIPLGPHAPAGVLLVDGGIIQLDQTPGANWEDTRQSLTPPQLAGTPMDLFLERLASFNSTWLPDDQALRDLLMQIILANFEIHEDETICPRLSFEHHMQIVRALWEFKTYEKYQRLRCPVLLVLARPSEPQSEREAGFTAAKERGTAHLQSRHANVSVRWMDDTFHDIPLQRPVELGSLISEFSTGL
jgi:pimeloyl-ACP methyl ester carboxylesterase